MAVDGFRFDGSGELSGICLILEGEKNRRPTSVPHQRRCIVAGRLLLTHKTFEHDLGCRQFVLPDGYVGLHYRAHDKMGSQLAVFK
jgi:hypothetical protein